MLFRVNDSTTFYTCDSVNQLKSNCSVHFLFTKVWHLFSRCGATYFKIVDLTVRQLLEREATTLTIIVFLLLVTFNHFY